MSRVARETSTDSAWTDAGLVRRAPALVEGGGIAPIHPGVVFLDGLARPA